MHSQIATLHFITLDQHSVSHAAQVLHACRAGVKWVQLRIKQDSKAAIMSAAQQARQLCSRYNARLIINDHLDIALACRADGVHLGQHDMPLAEARRAAGSHFIIGGTANTPAQALDMAMQGADYIGAGPFRYTTTKQRLAPVLGVKGLEAITQELDRKAIKVPLVAVGGIRPEDLAALGQLPLHGVAVSAAIARDPKPEGIIREIMNHFNQRKYHVPAS